nr:hypothetical protein [Tanacetum cinerariifolium]
MQQPMLNLEDITDPTTAMNMNVENQVIQNVVQNPRIQNVGNQNGLIGVPGNANQNSNGNGNLVADRAKVRPRRRGAAYLQTQLLIAQKEKAGIQLQAEEFDLMAAAVDLDEIEKQASTSGTQTDKAPVYDSDGSTARISSNLRNRQIAQPGMNMGHDRQMQMIRECQESGCSESKSLEYWKSEWANWCSRKWKSELDKTQLLIAQKEEAGIQLQAEEYDLMAAAADLDEIEELNANWILMANLQQASSSEELYTELLDPILETQQVPQNDNNVISEVTDVEQGGETVEQHPVNFEETRALYESLYQNLAVEVEKVNSINRKLKETNADLTTELARYKNQKRCFKISQEKYDKLEWCYQKSVYQEQCL